MKRSLIALVILLSLSNFNFAQEMISNFNFGGSNIKSYVRSFESTNYLITIFSSNELTVHKIVSKDSIEHLYTQLIPELSVGKKFKFKNEFLLFHTGSKILAYNFKKNTLLSKIIPTNFIEYRWNNIFENYALFQVTSSNHITKVYKFTYEIGITQVEYILKNTIDTKDSLYLLKVRNNNSSIVNYLSYNIKSKDSDTIIHNTNVSYIHSLKIHNNNIWFNGKDNVLYSFDLLTGQEKSYPTMQSKFKHQNINIVENKLYFLNADETGLQIQVLDLSTSKKIIDTKSQYFGGVKRRYFIIKNNKIIFRTNFEQIMVLDMVTGKYKLFLSNLQYLNQFDIIHDKFLVNYYNSNFVLINLDTLNELKITNKDKIEEPFRGYHIVKSGNNYIISLIKHYTKTKSIYILDFNKLECSISNKMDNTTSGLKENSKFLKNSNSLALVTEDIYKIIDNNVSKINSNPIKLSQKNNITIFNNYLGFIEYNEMNTGHENVIVKYDGNETTNMISRSKRIYDFSIIGNIVYFVPDKRKLVKYNTITKTLVEITSDLKQISYYKYIYTNNNDIIYRTVNGIFKIHNNGTPELITSHLHYYNKKPFSLKDISYDIFKEGIYKIKNDNSVEPISSLVTNKAPNNSEIYIDKKEENFLFEANDSLLYHYDGENLSSPIKYLKNNQDIWELGNSIFSIGYCNQTYYDCNTKEQGKFGGLEEKETVINLFFSKNDTFLVTSQDHYKGYYLINFYKSTNKFQNQTLLYEMNDIEYKIFPKYFSFGDEGLFYSFNKIVFVDNNQEFHVFDNVKGCYNDNRNISVEEFNGYIYFLGIDKIKGRQVYRYKLSAHPDITNQPKENRLMVYPNPASDFIYITQEKEIKGNYSIFTTEGRIVKTGVLNTSRIDISELGKGIFYLQIQNNDQNSSCIFIK